MPFLERPAVALAHSSVRSLRRLFPAGSRRRQCAEAAALAMSPIIRALQLLTGLVVGPLGARKLLSLLWLTSVPDSPNPRITILIAAHGHWRTTRKCLSSIKLAHEPSEEVEVLLVDDASPDKTAKAASKVKGLRLARLEENVGFTRAINFGLSQARGQHVVILNNDTIVLDGWLKALLSSADQEDVGIVGATLLFPNGQIQEAGGAIFSDGSASNLSRGTWWRRDPHATARDVDYCSGAALLLTRQLLDKVEGFDERYSPAYYEDTDLAMTARLVGLRVVFEPRAVVVHFEGVSHGRDLNKGLKRYQERNRVFFFEKWREELQSFPNRKTATRLGPPLPPGRLVFVFDENIPSPNRDSGSRRMVEILRSLVGWGLHPILVPTNRFSFREYVGALDQLGVTVWMHDFDPWASIDFRLSDVECFIVSRPNVAEKWFVPLRLQYPSIPIIYDTVDLHFLRWEREKVLEPRAHRDVDIDSMRRFENLLVSSAGATLFVSQKEKELLSKVQAPESLHIVSNAHRVEQTPAVGFRKGLIFVGNFQHPPNADGVLWFLDHVFPHVQAALPSTTLTVVGQYVPSEILSRSTSTVHVKGWLPEIRPLYDTARVAIAPLRFGAGVKGKVGEAMALGVPTVVTPLAAEGIPLKSGRDCLLAESAEDFATSVVRLLNDDHLWEMIRLGGYETVAQALSPQVLHQSVGQVLRSLQTNHKSTTGRFAHKIEIEGQAPNVGKSGSS